VDTRFEIYQSNDSEISYSTLYQIPSILIYINKCKNRKYLAHTEYYSEFDDNISHKGPIKINVQRPVKQT